MELLDLDELTNSIDARSRQSRIQNDRPAQPSYDPLSLNETGYQFYPTLTGNPTSPTSSIAPESSLPPNSGAPSGESVQENVTQPVADFLRKREMNNPLALLPTGSLSNLGSSSEHSPPRYDNRNKRTDPSSQFIPNIKSTKHNNPENIETHHNSEPFQDVVNVSNSNSPQQQHGPIRGRVSSFQMEQDRPNMLLVNENPDAHTSRYNSSHQQHLTVQPLVSIPFPQQGLSNQAPSGIIASNSCSVVQRHAPGFGSAPPAHPDFRPQHYPSGNPISIELRNLQQSSHNVHKPSILPQQKVHNPQLAECGTNVSNPDPFPTQHDPGFGENPLEQEDGQTAGPGRRIDVLQHRQSTGLLASSAHLNTHQMNSVVGSQQVRSQRYRPYHHPTHGHTGVPGLTWQQPAVSSSSQAQSAQPLPADQTEKSRDKQQEAQRQDPLMNSQSPSLDGLVQLRHAPRNPIRGQNVPSQSGRSAAQNRMVPHPPNPPTGWHYHPYNQLPPAPIPQQGAQQLQNLFCFDQGRNVIMPVYFHPQGPFGIHLPISTGQMGSNSHGVAPMPINHPPQIPMPQIFENVRREWAQHPTSRFQLDGVDLRSFLFNPEGYKVVPQPVRMVRSSIDLWRMHWRPNNLTENYLQAWAQFSDQEKIVWSQKLNDLKTQQENQKEKGWIKLHRSKGWKNEKRRQDALL
ncbi:unnamed protein product [Caenorhabditis brenneri]